MRHYEEETGVFLLIKKKQNIYLHKYSRHEISLSSEFLNLQANNCHSAQINTPTSQFNEQFSSQLHGTHCFTKSVWIFKSSQT